MKRNKKRHYQSLTKTDTSGLKEIKKNKNIKGIQQRKSQRIQGSGREKKKI